jgi:hypothetical protein
MNHAWTHWPLALLLFPALVVSSRAGDLTLGTNTLVLFASVDQARQVLTNRDDFIAAFSPFDREVRMKTNHLVAEKEFLDFLGQQARPWTADETERLGTAVRTLGARCARWTLPLPTRLWLVKTSGAEEGNACYTRQNAILLPQREVEAPPDALERILAHELFHVLSRHNPELRESLYGIIGFHPINEVELPVDLRPRKLTNPDGFQSRWSITVTNGGVGLSVVPILFGSADHYDVAQGGELFRYLVFKLLEVEKAAGRWQPRLMAGKPRLLEVPEVSGFYERVGRNTDYIIHPDEILAENFVKLIRCETNVATPRVLEQMGSRLVAPHR